MSCSPNDRGTSVCSPGKWTVPGGKVEAQDHSEENTAEVLLTEYLRKLFAVRCSRKSGSKSRTLTTLTTWFSSLTHLF